MPVTDDRRTPLPDEPSTVPTTERQALAEMLDFYRAVLRRKAEGLSKAQLAATTAATTLSLGALLKHLAYVEDGWFTETFAGQPQPEPWASAPFDLDRDWELHSAAGDDPADLLALYGAAIARSRAIADAARSLDDVAAGPTSPGRGPVNLRWILLHMVEEYARHAGHADLLREAIDGVTGD